MHIDSMSSGQMFAISKTNFSGIHSINYSNVLDGSLMMTSSNGNIFRVTGHLCGEFTGSR